MKRIDISLESLFETIKQGSENVGHYDPITETLSIFTHQKEELLESIQQLVEEYISKEINDSDEEQDTVDFTEDDTFLLSDDDDEDEDDEDEDDDEDDY